VIDDILTIALIAGAGICAIIGLWQWIWDHKR